MSGVETLKLVLLYSQDYDGWVASSAGVSALALLQAPEGQFL